MDEYDDNALSSPSDSSSSRSSSTAKPSCSHWWQGPLYVATTLTLAYIAFKTPNQARPENQIPPGHGPTLDAARALRLHGGYHVTAALIQISPELFIGPGPRPETTIFAIGDPAIANLTGPPRAMRRILRYHASAAALPMAALLKKPQGFCFETLADGEKLKITRNDAVSGSVMINNVSISDPDLFLSGPITIHGVSAPFDVDRSPPCDVSDQDTLVASNGHNQAVQWTRIVRLLSANGFVSFAIGLNSVLDNIIQDYENLSCVSIFAPPNSGFLSSPSPFLDRVVRIHILPQKFGYLELGALENLTLKTLVPSYDLKIDRFSNNFGVNGVEINKPDLFLSEKFVVHGISREFDVVELFSSFM